MYLRSKFKIIPNINQDSLQDVYNELFDIKDFKFLENSLCFTCYDGFLVAVTVFSSLGNKKRRNEIRQVWDAADCVHLVFLVGITDNETIMSDIKIESAEKDDIVQGNFIDSYSNLTYKHIMDFKWVSYYCSQAKYVIKVDDDVTIDMQILREKLKSKFWKKTGLIACKVHSNKSVIRESSKWAVSKEEYANDNYPDYCNGPVIIYSKDVVYRLLEESRTTPFFRIDDVYVTGILARKIGVVPKGVKSLFWIYFDTKSKAMLDNDTVQLIQDGNGSAPFYKIYKDLRRNLSLKISRNIKKMFSNLNQLGV